MNKKRRRTRELTLWRETLKKCVNDKHGRIPEQTRRQEAPATGINDRRGRILELARRQEALLREVQALRSAAHAEVKCAEDVMRVEALTEAVWLMEEALEELKEAAT